MGEVEELERLKQLKDSGALSEAEYEVAKHKILNGTTKKKFNKSIIFFVLTAVLIIISICSLVYKNNCDQTYYDYMEEHMTDDIALKWKSITQSEYDRIQDKKIKLAKSTNTAQTITVASFAITGISLATGIVLLVIEKKNKN